MLPQWGRSLAGELKSHMAQDTVKKKEKEKCDEDYHKEKPAEGQHVICKHSTLLTKCLHSPYNTTNFVVT